MQKQKWIIESGIFKTDKFDFHSEIADNPNSQKICGGFLYIDLEKKILYLFSKSSAYGSCSKELLTKIYTNKQFPPELANYKWKFSKSDSLEEAIADSLNLIEI